MSDPSVRLSCSNPGRVLLCEDGGRQCHLDRRPLSSALDLPVRCSGAPRYDRSGRQLAVRRALEVSGNERSPGAFGLVQGRGQAARVPGYGIDRQRRCGEFRTFCASSGPLCHSGHGGRALSAQRAGPRLELGACMTPRRVCHAVPSDAIVNVVERTSVWAEYRWRRAGCNGHPSLCENAGTRRP